MQKSKKSLKLTVLLAMLTAISIICGKYLAIRGGDIMRFSLENMPIIFAGIAFGPIAGGAVGLVADLAGCLMVGYTINPVVAVGAAVIGVVSGALPHLLKRVKMGDKLITAVTVAVAHLIGSVIIKTLGLAAYYNIPLPLLFLWRTLNYLIVGVIDGAVVYVLLKNKGIQMQINRANVGKKMSYDDTVEYIHSVSNFFCKPGTQRIRELCEGLGNPQKKLKFVHVAGTNGKGSVCAMLDSILRTEGYKAGLFTSPYVREFNERMRVNGQNIPNDTLSRITEKVKTVAEGMSDSPTEFEIITAIAFEYFKEERCDVVILEVGMGGRFDATNIIDTPLLSIITGVAIDHVNFLGDTLEKIATEKAGIIKQGSAVIFGGMDTTAEAIIEAEAAKKQSMLYKIDYSALKINTTDLEGTDFDYKGRKGLKISLLGSYQPRNAAVVLDAVDYLATHGLSAGEEAIRLGLTEARWPARFEVIEKEPTVIFDGAHNPQGVEAAVDSIKQYFGEKRVVILSGVLRDKDYVKIAKSISEVASEVYTVTPDNPRGLTAEEYAGVYTALNIKATPCNSINDALSKGMLTAKEHDTALCCLGSLYTYGDIMKIIK